MYTSEQYGIMEVTGDRIKFATPEITELDSLVVNFEPVQDLHGYDYPWAPGAGVNKIPYPYHHTTQISNGITWTDNGDGTVTANGKATANSDFVLRHHSNNFTLPVGNYILTGCPAGGSSTTYAMWFAQRNVAQSSWVNSGYDTGTGLNVTITNADYPVQITLNIRSGVTVDNMVFRPLLRLSSVTDESWSPYSNVCPITGRDSVTVYVSPNPSIVDGTKEHDIEFGQAVYGGTLDVVTGLLTVTQKSVTFNGTENSWNGGNIGTANQRYYIKISDAKESSDFISNLFEKSNTTSTSQNWGLALISASKNFIVYDTGHVFANLASFKTWVESHNIQVVYELETPVTIQLTPMEITTLKNMNYVWTSEHNIITLSFSYRKELQPIMLNYEYCWTYPKAYIDRMEATLAARIKALEDAADDSKGASEDVKATEPETVPEEITEPETVPEEITEPEESVTKNGGK